MASYDRKRKREESDSGSSVREIKPEPAFIDLGESDNGNENALRKIPEAPRPRQTFPARQEVVGPAPAGVPRPRQDNKESVAVGADRTTRQVDLDSFSVVAEHNQELIRGMMDLPEKLREDLAVKGAAIQTDITTSIVALTKQFNETLDETKREIKDKVDGYSRGLKTVEKNANTTEASVKELDKKVDKKIKVARDEANKNRGVNVKAEVKKEVNECLRGFGAYLTNYFGANNAAAGVPGPLPAAAAAAAGVPGPLPTATAAAAGLPGLLPSATAAAADVSGPAISLVPSDSVSEAVPLLARDKFMKYQVLTNKGYHNLMTIIKFTNVNYLVQLLKLDNNAITRRCIIFSDMKFNNYQVDYVLHSGFAVRQLGDGSGSATAGGHEQSNLLKHVDLSQLRLLKMKIDSRAMLRDDEVKYKEWARFWKPPTYVYDLGELVLRKRCCRHPNALVSTSTPYNLLLEVSRTGSKRVWIVMAPEHELSQKAVNSVKDSNLAFNGLEYNRIALVANDISEIEFDRAEFFQSAAGFEAAYQLVLKSRCPGVPLVDFDKAVDIKKMCADLA
ncbi:hypothetical protein PG985_010313 [Apiospora marii]|uniref:uncharacterized protein n=1 Tax=Apiospora marii TaxID=335849 RepID=UPI003131F8EB